MAFAQDLSIPDRAELAQGVAFEKKWRVSSDGCASWPSGTQLVYVSGDRMGGAAAVDVPQTAVGNTADIAVAMQAPMAPGT